MEECAVSFVPPPYPYDRLTPIKTAADQHDGGAIDCSIGTPVDAPPADVLAELARGSGARSYPPSIGTADYRGAIQQWLGRRFGVHLDLENIAACVGTKEFVASTAQYLHLRSPEKDTVLYPAISYPTYAMGATLAGLRAVPVEVVNGRLQLDTVSPADVARALMVWSNSPSNPTGHLDDLAAVAHWGVAHGVLVVSDECYAEFTWSDRPRSILEFATTGVIAVHSISKRSNLAGLRAGFFAGDAEVVAYLRAVRQHAGLMVPGPVQAAVALAYGDDEHVALQRLIYFDRLSLMAEALTAAGVTAPMPEGGFYLWCHRDGDDGWSLARWIAEVSGVVTSPGELYGEAASNFARLAVVQPTPSLAIAAQRIHEWARQTPSKV
jgi:succinyldiaminopimelate transaminase